MSDILSGENPEQGKTETEVPAEPYRSSRKEHRKREWEAQGRDPETGHFVPKEKPEEKVETAPEEPKAEVKAEVKEEPKAPPVEVKAEVKAEFTEKERAFLATAQEERRKRQELERRIAEMEKKPAEAPKQFFDDPEAYLKTLKEEVNSSILNSRLQTSEAMARQRYQDFDEKIGVFSEIIQKTPGLHQQWLAAPDPAEFAYRTGKNFKDLQDAGGIEQLRAKLEKETRLKLEAEFKEKEAALQKEKAKLPPSLSDARGTTSHRPAWSGPTSMDDILSRQ